MIDSTDLADVRDETTGLTPRQAAAKLVSHLGDVLTDALACGQALIVAETHGAVPDEPVLVTLKRWHARRQQVADALAEAVRKYAAENDGGSAKLEAALSAYDAAYGGKGGE